MRIELFGWNDADLYVDYPQFVAVLVEYTNLYSRKSERAGVG